MGKFTLRFFFFFQTTLMFILSHKQEMPKWVAKRITSLSLFDNRIFGFLVRKSTSFSYPISFHPWRVTNTFKTSKSSSNSFASLRVKTRDGPPSSITRSKPSWKKRISDTKITVFVTDFLKRAGVRHIQGKLEADFSQCDLWVVPQLYHKVD